jgi:Short C-terminal domain
MRTYNRLADHLYDQLAGQGAFEAASWADAPSADASAASDARDESQETSNASSAVERLRLLDQLRAEGVVTGEEYEKKKREILRDL